MSQLTLRGLTEEEDSLILVDPTGAEHRLAVDDAVISAVRRSRSAHAAESPRGEALRPRDIQTMIRQGLTAEDVAAETGEDIEHIRRYERPVLSERAHIAQQAGRVVVYPDSDTGAPTPLRELVDTRLELREVDPADTQWDAWKRQDGTWYVELAFSAGGRPRTAGWTFAHGSVVAQDDEALWLSDSGPTDSGPIPDYGTGEERRRRASAPSGPSASSLTGSPGARPAPARDHQTETGRILESLRRRRGVAPSAGDSAPVGTQPTGAGMPSPTTGAGGLRLVGDADDTTIDGAHTAPSQPEDAQDASIVALPSSAGSAPSAPAAHDHHTEPIGTPRFDAQPTAASASSASQPTADEAEAAAPSADSAAADGPGSDHPSLLDDPALADWSDGRNDAEAEAPAEDSSAQAAPDEEAQTQRRRGRASVPSWDEIMFGGRGRD